MIARKIAETSKHKVTSLAILKNFSSGKSFAFHEANLKTVVSSRERPNASITLTGASSGCSFTSKRKSTCHPGLRRAHSQSGSRRRKLTHVHDLSFRRRDPDW